MASVFDIFGSINLETRAFDGSLQGVVSKLKGADKALDSTISKSNKLGDTSATVARRYEKLSEGIQAQRNKLLDNALAFEKGEISAKKFASVVTQVEKSTEGLSSRLKDAKARVTELNETGLTHFQQQITQAVDQANSKLDSFRQKLLAAQQPQSTDLLKNLFGNLSGQQKTQLSFQLNDIITGLASGQSPAMILAQQGGQIFQVFQQGKKAQEGITTAINASTVAQAAFAAESNAAAKAIASAHASSTILGASVVSLGTVLAAGLVTIAAVYKITQDIEKAAKKRLENEEKITAEWNKQHGLIGQIKKELADAAKERAFGSFVGDASLADLNASRSTIFSQLEANQKKITDEMQRRQLLVAKAPGLLPDDFISKASEVGSLSTDQIKSMSEQLKQIDAQIYAEKKRLDDDYNKRVMEGAERSATSTREAYIQAEVDIAKKREEMVKKSIEDAKKWAEHVKNAAVEVRNIFENTSDNPFTRIFSDGEQAVQKMLEATKGLGSELQKTLKGLIDGQTQSKAFKQSMENSLKAAGLRSEAAQFLGGAKPTISQSLQQQLDAIGAGSPYMSQTFGRGKGGAFTELIKNADPNQRARDQKIIELTRGMADAELTPAQKQQAAGARIREAAALDAEKPDAIETQKQLVEVLKKLQEGKALNIDINDPTNAATVKNATPATVNLRYPQR